MNEYERVQRQFRCHKAPIVKTPLHEVPAVAGTHIIRSILSPGMRFTVGIFLSRRQVRILFVREIWPDPVAHHLPPSASAEIFHERKVRRGPEKRRTIWEMCFSTGTPFDETLTSHVPSHSGKNILIISTKTQQKLSFRIKRNFSWL